MIILIENYNSHNSKTDTNNNGNNKREHYIINNKGNTNR